jgi:hypothetical protein
MREGPQGGAPQPAGGAPAPSAHQLVMVLSDLDLGDGAALAVRDLDRLLQVHLGGLRALTAALRRPNPDPMAAAIVPRMTDALRALPDARQEGKPAMQEGSFSVHANAVPRPCACSICPSPGLKSEQRHAAAAGARPARARTARSPSSNTSHAYSECAQCSAGGPRPMSALPRMRSYCALPARRSPRSSAILASPRMACWRTDTGGEPDISSNALTPSVVHPARARRALVARTKPGVAWTARSLSPARASYAVHAFSRPAGQHPVLTRPNSNAYAASAALCGAQTMQAWPSRGGGRGARPPGP